MRFEKGFGAVVTCVQIILIPEYFSARRDDQKCELLRPDVHATQSFTVLTDLPDMDLAGAAPGDRLA